MSNTTCRSHGIAQRALALFMAIALATALTPSFALAEEANNSTSIAAEQSSAAGSISSPSAADNAANKADAAPGNESQASGSNSAAEHTTTNSSKANAGESTGPSNANNAPDQSANGAESANQASSTQAETVSATLKISVYGTTLVSHAFSIEKGKTVKDLLNLAASQGYIGAIDPEKDLNTYDNGLSHFIKFLTINGNVFGDPATPNAYWMSSISANGASRNDAGIEHDTIDCDNYTYALSLAKYPDDGTKYDNGTGNYPTTPDAAHPDKATTTDTTSFVKNNGNTSTVVSAPTNSDNASLKWSISKYNSCNRSNVLSIDNSLYIATSKLGASYTDPADPAILHKLDTNGNEISSLKLFCAIDSTCRMVYTDGIIVIPLSNGRLQGVSASEMKTLWVSKATAPGDMSMSTVTASGGMVFTGTTRDWGASSGTFFGINAITGECVWANRNNDAGYYWAGACKIGSVLVYGDSAGWLKAVEPATGKTVSQIKLSESAIQSTVISNNAETKAYVMTTDGFLHEVEVGFDGSLSEQSKTELKLHGGGTSTPTLFEGNIYVGGGTWNTKGTFNVIDAATMQVKTLSNSPSMFKALLLLPRQLMEKLMHISPAMAQRRTPAASSPAAAVPGSTAWKTTPPRSFSMQPAAWPTTAPSPSPWVLTAPCTGPTILARCSLWQAPPLPATAATTTIPTTPKHLKNLKPTTNRTARHPSAMRASMLLPQPPLALEAHLPQLKHP